VSKILIIYWSQTGQLTRILKSISAPLESAGHQVDFVQYHPLQPFPFPWTNRAFFDLMPETVLGIPAEVTIDPIANPAQYDLVILGYSPWFLSPSLLVQGLFRHSLARQIFGGKPVVTVTGCRNMWINAMERIKASLLELDAKLVGNIALVDEASNAVSLLTLSAWLFWGKKENLWGVFPTSGISEKQIENATQFGSIIDSHLKTNSFEGMQPELVKGEAVKVNPNLIPIETRGIKLFIIWANFIRKKGGPGNPARQPRLRAYLVYLLTALGLIGPIVTVLAWILRTIFPAASRRQIAYFEGITLRKQ
jgi:hypothetical protein